MVKLYKLLKNSYSKLFKSKFTRNIILITGGAVAAQTLNMIFSPIITRVYLPEEYGMLAILSSILMTLSYPSFMYEMAIPIEKKDNKAINVLWLSVIVLLLFTTTLTMLLVIKGEEILNIFDASQLNEYIYFIHIGVCLTGFLQILTQWVYRRKNFKLISKTRISQNLLGNLTKILAGISGIGVTGLLIGEIVKKTASIITLTSDMIKKEKKLIKKIKKKDVVWSMKRYKAFPIYQTPSTFLSSFKNQLPVFSLAFYGSQVVGLYGLANTIVKLPMTLVGHSVRNVFYAEAASIGRSNGARLKSLSDKLFKKMVIIGLIPTILLIIFGPQLFSIVFGSHWYGSGVYSRYLALAIYADFIFSPVSRVYEVLERQKEKITIDLVGLILVASAFSIARFLSSDTSLAR